MTALAFGLASSAVLAAVVVAATRTSGDADARPTVAIVGDSITEQGESILEDGLSDDWRLLIDGRSGFTVAEQLPAARDLADGDPVQVVVNLGTNDVTKGNDLGQSVADLAEVVASFPDAACVHLVTINEGIRLAGVSLGDRSSQLNRAMVALAAADPRIHVIDWSAVVAADEAGDQPDGPIVNDTVHPTTRGQRVLTALYAEALAACSPAPVAGGGAG